MLKNFLAQLIILVFTISTLLTPQLAFAQDLHGPRIKIKDGTATNWSGYALETNLTSPQNSAVTDVKGSWVVPAVTCTPQNTYSSAWLGIDGYSDNTVEQTGTEQDCSNGQPSYYAWYEMYPHWGYKINMKVKAGDTMNAEVKYTGSNKYTLTLNDQSTGQTFSTIQKLNAHRQSAEWILEAPWSNGVLPLSNFGTMNFSNAQAVVNNKTVSINDPSVQNDPITMVNDSGAVKAQPYNLSSDGKSFSIQWLSSN